MSLRISSEVATPADGRAWKVLIRLAEGRLRSPLYQYVWAYGINKSDRSGTNLTGFEREVGEASSGFHVFLKYANAMEQTVADPIVAFGNYRHKCVLVEVLVRPEHLVAAGRWFIGYKPTAVYTQVELLGPFTGNA